MSDQNLMEAQIRQSFDVGDCLCVENEEIFCIVEDASSKSVIQYGNPTDGFAIHNPETKDIFILALDNCLMKNIIEGKRCDCAVFDDECFCFVELKLNATAPRQATDRLREARKQLGNTIVFFRETFANSKKDFLGHKLEAYAVMRQNIYPKDSASRKAVFVEFFDKYEVLLFEKNKKVFGEDLLG